MIRSVVDKSRYTMNGPVGGSIHKPLWSMWYVGSPVTGDGVIVHKCMLCIVVLL